MRAMEPVAALGDDALLSPSVARNRQPIAAVLRRVLPPSGTVLEVASGTGEHAVHFARALPSLTWQPTDPDESALRSIAAHRAASGLANLRAPFRLDVRDADWASLSADAVLSINMIHIAPWAATVALMEGAGRVLAAGAILFLYGPFFEDGTDPAPGNVAFDESLRERDPGWGVRRLAEVAACAGRFGLVLAEREAMPANNLAVVFRRA
jgi:SAM-dependent methyltransferase